MYVCVRCIPDSIRCVDREGKEDKGWWEGMKGGERDKKVRTERGEGERKERER